MSKTIMITGATDGIGLETARMLAAAGHSLLLHGRSKEKLEHLQQELAGGAREGQVETFRADLSKLEDVAQLAAAVASKHAVLHVLINNAGVFRTSTPKTEHGFDVRFMVNSIAPYLLTKRLLPLLGEVGRVVNLSSAAQSSVNLEAVAAYTGLSDGAAYAQSKLAITMWSRGMARGLGAAGPVIVAVNPASMLGSKMVKEAFGVGGGDLKVGADILVRAALSDEFTDASGLYYDNDSHRFADPHPDALDQDKAEKLIALIEKIIVEGGQ